MLLTTDEKRKMLLDVDKSISRLSKTVTATTRASDVNFKKLDSTLKDIKKLQDSHAKNIKDQHKIMKAALANSEKFLKGSLNVGKKMAGGAYSLGKQFGSEVGRDFKIDVGNVLGLTIARTAPLVGYAVAKLFDTQIFRNLIKNMQGYLAGMFKFMGQKFWGMFKSIGGFFGRLFGRKKESPELRAAEMLKSKGLKVPGMQSGGVVKRGGLVELHTGEIVINPAASNTFTDTLSKNIGKNVAYYTKIMETKGELSDFRKRQIFYLRTIASTQRKFSSVFRRTLLSIIASHPMFLEMAAVTKELYKGLTYPLRLLFRPRGGWRQYISRAKDPRIRTAHHTAGMLQLLTQIRDAVAPQEKKGFFKRFGEGFKSTRGFKIGRFFLNALLDKGGKHLTEKEIARGDTGKLKVDVGGRVGRGIWGSRLGRLFWQRPGKRLHDPFEVMHFWQGLWGLLRGVKHPWRRLNKMPTAQSGGIIRVHAGEQAEIRPYKYRELLKYRMMDVKATIVAKLKHMKQILKLDKLRFKTMWGSLRDSRIGKAFRKMGKGIGFLAKHQKLKTLFSIFGILAGAGFSVMKTVGTLAWNLLTSIFGGAAGGYAGAKAYKKYASRVKAAKGVPREPAVRPSTTRVRQVPPRRPGGPSGGKPGVEPAKPPGRIRRALGRFKLLRIRMGAVKTSAIFIAVMLLIYKGIQAYRQKISCREAKKRGYSGFSITKDEFIDAIVEGMWSHFREQHIFVHGIYPMPKGAGWLGVEWEAKNACWNGLIRAAGGCVFVEGISDSGRFRNVLITIAGNSWLYQAFVQPIAEGLNVAEGAERASFLRTNVALISQIISKFQQKLIDSQDEYKAARSSAPWYQALRVARNVAGMTRHIAENVPAAPKNMPPVPPRRRMYESPGGTFPNLGPGIPTPPRTSRATLLGSESLRRPPYIAGGGAGGGAGGWTGAGGFVPTASPQIMSYLFRMASRGINLTGLTSILAQRLNQAGQSYLSETGRKLLITSGWRSIAHQQRLFDRYGPGRAAHPGTSMHNYGLAVDIDSRATQSADFVARNLPRFKLWRPIRGEPWHFEPIETAPRAYRHKILAAANKARLAGKSGAAVAAAMIGSRVGKVPLQPAYYGPPMAGGGPGGAGGGGLANLFFGYHRRLAALGGGAGVSPAGIPAKSPWGGPGAVARTTMSPMLTNLMIGRDRAGTQWNLLGMLGQVMKGGFSAVSLSNLIAPTNNVAPIQNPISNIPRFIRAIIENSSII